MYELLALSLLMRWPLHAYLIAKMANEIIGPEEQLNRGTLSTLLARLEQEGLIAPTDPATAPFPADRPSRVLAITPRGRERFFALMLDTTTHPGSYSRLFHIKALHLDFLPPESQLFLVEHYLAHYQKLLYGKQAEKQAFTRNRLNQEHTADALREAALDYMRLKIEHWQIELAWGQALRERIIARLRHPDESRSDEVSTHLTGQEER